MSDIRIRVAAGTDVGLVRTNNEDNFVVCPDLNVSDWTIPQANKVVGLGSYGSLLVVADGMGGANAGEVASAIAVESVQKRFTEEALASAVASDEAIQDFLVSVVKEADLNILNAAKENVEHAGMGTTIVMAWIIGAKAYICWCGDSRCYVFNPKQGLTQLSKDHSFVQELVDRGELEPENMHDHPYSNVITRCLSDGEQRAVPEVRLYNLQVGDLLLLCSDGLSSVSTDDQILEVLKNRGEKELMQVKEELIKAALDAGGYDNVTVALCEVLPSADENTDEAVEEPQPMVSTVTTAPAKSKVGYWLRVLLFLVLTVAVILWLVNPDLMKTWFHLQ
ncbi:MAG: serine/threonine-protein phosphatase [Bacteroidaceae bacterium]|nr:serine/threonine-protein phosphatase [Bacteroidaceae bacterium]